MTRFKPEFILAGILLLICVAVAYWQAPGSKLSAAEVETLITQIEKMAPMPAAEKATVLPYLRAWALADDGRPVYMLNLMRYHDQLRPWPGTTVNAESPQAANRYYEQATVSLALPKGLSLAFSGEPMSTAAGASHSTNLFGHDPQADNWSRVLVVRYPSRRAFLDLISDPEYHKLMPYKFAALDLTLVPMREETVTPDTRLIVCVFSLIVLLGFGWWRSARDR